METGTKTIIGAFVLALSILFCLFCIGCGKRITTTERHSFNKDSISINNSFELTQNATWSDIGTVKPFDASKPMLWNGAWHYNTVIEFDKSIKKEIDIKANDNLSYKGSDEKKKGKETESNNENLLWTGLSFVVGLLFIVYLTLKKYKIL